LTGIRERVVRRATRRYVAGPGLADAVEVARPFEHSTLGFWDGPADSPRDVVSMHERAIAAIAATQLDSYVSIKLPALGGDDRAARLADVAAEAGVPLHFDSLAEHHANRTLALACRLGARGCDVGATLPGCWSRSARDAEVLAAAGVRARIVKGQWPGDREPGGGFLAVVEAVEHANGRAAIATHDASLVRAALVHLPHAELELLLGLPMAAAVRAAGLGTPLRIYVPYGRGYLPYAVRRAFAHPGLLWWLVRDLVFREVVRPLRPA
jgi:proline dehydrogenase